MPNFRILADVYDRLVAAAGYWTVLGLFYDLSWHLRHHVDTFFTFQHAILYSGLAALAIVTFVGGRREPGFRTTAAGLALFAIGGAADLVEHQFLGIEHDFDALLSPTHLAIGFGLMIVVCAPLRLRRDAAACIVSLAAFVELLHFITHPFFRLNAGARFAVMAPHQLTANAVTLETLRAYEQGGGLIAALFGALLIAVPLFYLARAIRVPRGGCTILLVLSTALIAYADATNAAEFFVVVCAAVLAGIVADILVERPTLCGCAAAGVYIAAWIGGTAITGGVWWSASFIAGTVVLSTAFAYFASLAYRTMDVAPG